MLVGSFVVSRITGFVATWIALTLLLAVHLAMNYAAVRSVQMTSLNRQRANIVFSALLDSDPDLDLNNPNPEQKPTTKTEWTLLTPAETSNKERIFYPDNLLAWDTRKLGFCHLGVNLPSFLGSPGRLTTSVGPTTQLSTLTTLFATEHYMLLFTHTAPCQGRVVLKPDCSVEDRLKAWCHALLAARILSGSDVQNEEELVLDVVSRTLEFLNERSRFRRYVEGLREVGWDLGIAALETRSGRRVCWS